MVKLCRLRKKGGVLLLHATRFLSGGLGCALLTCGAASAQDQISPRPFEEWIVDAVSGPFPVRPGDEYSHLFSMPVGDLNSDGRTELLNYGVSISPIPGSSPVYRLFLSFGQGMTIKERHFVNTIDLLLSPDAGAVLRTPSGTNIGALDWWTGAIVIWDPVSGQEVHRLQPSPPPAGLPATSGFHGFSSAGDLNSDGFDDIFYWTRAFPGSGPAYYVHGRIDGATGVIDWQSYSIRTYTLPGDYLYSIDSPPDYDQDGISDYLLVPWTSNFKGITYTAVSGADGSIIWEFPFSSTYTHNYRVTSTADDFSRDGVSDVVSVVPPEVVGGSVSGGHIVLIDGQTGTSIWSRDLQAVLDELSPAQSLVVHEPVFRSVSSHLPQGRIVVPITVADISGDRQGTIQFEESSGIFLGITWFPEELEPWFPDPLDPRTYALEPLGDQNRDGYREIGVVNDLYPPNVSRHLGLNPRTLVMPDQLPVGDLALGHVDLPNAANMNGYLVASLQFSGGSGWSIGNWNTGLEFGPLLAASLINPLPIPLNSNGQGHFTIRHPGHPGLSNRLLFFRVVVPSTGGSGGIQTLSSVSWTRVH